MGKKDNEALNAYVSSQENEMPPQGQVVPEAGPQVPPQQDDEPTNLVERARAARIKRMEEMGGMADDGLRYQDNLGWVTIEVSSLPTEGLFYPEGAKIRIKAARGAEIKHWSTMNDQDLKNVAQIDDIINYIIERCVRIDFGVPGSSWRDLKDVDRFYLLLCVQELTFPNGENELMVPISENKEIPLQKEMIDFIHIPEDIMRYYSPEQRCFVFKMKTGREINMYIPSIGVNQWCNNYAYTKSQINEGFDRDFIQFAPFLIADVRRLNVRTYEDMITDSQGWSTKEWSLIAYVRDSLMAAAEAKIKYTNESGSEVSIPLNFRGGIKALFTIQDPLSILC